MHDFGVELFGTMTMELRERLDIVQKTVIHVTFNDLVKVKNEQDEE